MTTSWTLTALDIVEDAFHILGKIDEAGDMPGAADVQVMLRALDVVLKELPIAGYVWPKMSSEATLTWVSGQTIALPSDYLAQPSAWRTDAGRKIPLEQIQHGVWEKMLDRTTTGTPSNFYISPDNVFYMYPVPTVDPGIYLQYQKIVDDASLASAPNLPQYFLGALGLGCAHETSLKYARDKPALRVDIERRWLNKRNMAIAFSLPNDNTHVTVAD